MLYGPVGQNDEMEVLSVFFFMYHRKLINDIRTYASAMRCGRRIDCRHLCQSAISWFPVVSSSQ